MPERQRKRQTGMEPASRRITNVILLLLTLILVASCDQYPRDPQSSLNQIEQSGMLDVGVITNPPWTTADGSDSPAGVEARLMEQFARELGVDVVWHRGSEEKLFEGLSRYELDLVIGGITAGNPWKRKVGFTVPYFHGRAVVGAPQEYGSLTSLDRVTVAARQGEGFSEMIQSEGGRVQFMDDLAGTDMPVAARAWEIRALGMNNTGITLQQFEHVLAIPKGENALIMRLEDFLLAHADRQTVNRLLAREAQR